MKQQITANISDALTEQETAALQEILARELGVDSGQLTPEARLDTDLGADSLTLVEIIMALEDRFGVTVPDELAEHVGTVQDVHETLAKVLGR